MSNEQHGSTVVAADDAKAVEGLSHKKTKEIVAIDHYVFGRLLIIFGIAYIVCAIGATFIPPSFLG